MKAVRTVWAGGLFLLIALIAAVNSLPGALSFKTFDLTLFLRSLMPFLVITVLIERTVEVFFGIWVEPGNRMATAKLEKARAEQIAMPRSTQGAIDPEVNAHEELETRRANNLAHASLACLSLGVVVSIGGARLVETLVDSTPREPGTLFKLTDILLTAGLLGGGADGFHQFAQILKKFAQTTQAKLDAARRGVPAPAVK